MESKIKNVIIYDSWFEMFENKLTEEQIGKFMKAIGRWKNGEALQCEDPMVYGILIPIEKDLNDMFQNYKNKVERNRENGKKGGRPNNNPNNPNNPTGSLETHDNPNNLKDKDKDKEKVLPKVIPFPKPNISSIVEVGNGTPLEGSYPIHPTTTKDGGWEKVLSLFPEGKKKDYNNALIMWCGMEQNEKKQVIRHLSMYVKNTDIKFLKQIGNYFNEQLWKEMKSSSTQKEVGTTKGGMIDFNLIHWFQHFAEHEKWEEARKEFFGFNDTQRKELTKIYNEERNVRTT